MLLSIKEYSRTEFSGVLAGRAAKEHLYLYPLAHELWLATLGAGEQMPFKPEQLPFVQWKELVQKTKKAHDKAGLGYPLIFTLKDASGETLLEQTFVNVWNRKSAPKVVAPIEWDHPLTLIVTAGQEVTGEWTLGPEDATPRSLGKFRQMTFDEVEY
jgi:hypothetical protein